MELQDLLNSLTRTQKNILELYRYEPEVVTDCVLEMSRMRGILQGLIEIEKTDREITNRMLDRELKDLVLADV